jgi:hypothetical protein
MRKISLIIFGLVALVRAFPNPQDEDLAILADIAGMTQSLYIPSTLNIDLILWHTQLIVGAVKC